jgi:quercetin dioxygenase-like cupin family protein
MQRGGISVRITRIYDDNGQSRFADIEIPLNPREPTGGVSGFRASPSFAAGQCSLLSAPRGAIHEHAAPRRQLVVILSGEVEFETGDGNTRRIRPGDMVLADDTTGSGHITRFLTDSTALLVPVADIPA